MAKAPKRKLKVFRAQFGFYDSVVAAPSRAAALEAWGTRQDLFRQRPGGACRRPEVAEAARAHPGLPLRRAIGSEGAFSLDAAPPDLPAAPLRKPGGKPPAAASKRENPRHDPRALKAAEVELLGLEASREAEEAGFSRKQDELDARRQAAHAAYEESREALLAKIARARPPSARD